MLTLPDIMRHIDDMEQTMGDAAEESGVEMTPEDWDNFHVELIDKAHRRGAISDAVAAAARREFGIVFAPDWATYKLGCVVHHRTYGNVTLPDQVALQPQAWDGADMPFCAIDSAGVVVEILLSETDH